MIDRADAALSALQAVAESRLLYGSDHKVYGERLESARVALETWLAEGAATALLFSDRVVVGEASIPSGTRILAGVLGRLQRLGVAAVTFLPGVTQAEIESLIVSVETATDSFFRGSAHVHLRSIAAGVPANEPGQRTNLTSPRGTSTLANDNASGPIGTIDESTRGAFVPENVASTLQNVIVPLAQSGELDAGGVTNLAASLAGEIANSRTTMISLAAVRNHDEYTFVHTINVSMMSAGLAEAIGLRPDHVHDITCAALLHDVGKQRVPTEILNKAGKLNDEELAIIRRHPIDGAKILLGRKDVPDVAVAVALEHHMHRTGGGYPSMPEGWTMHVSSQIVQVADVFDALRTHRPYRAALPLHEFKELMLKDSPRIFDPELLSVFFERVASRTSREAA
ncbi:MAG: HD domain-containing protein [Phycisphaerales bacterium]|nr:MAG: HD domain-containing protein [Phycisphaerales bacterium]